MTLPWRAFSVTIQVNQEIYYKLVKTFYHNKSLLATLLYKSSERFCVGDHDQLSISRSQSVWQIRTS